MYQTIPKSSKSSISHSAHSIERNDYHENSMDPIVAPCKTMVIHVDLGGKRYIYSGISKTSELIYFYNQKEVVVFRILMPSGKLARTTDKPLQHIFKYPRPSPQSEIGRIAISKTWIVISTNRELTMVKLTSQSYPASNTLQKPYSDDWEPVGLAIHETEAGLKIAVGQRKSSRRFYEGRVLVFSVRPEAGARYSTAEPTEYMLPHKEFPKDVELSSDGKLIVCRSQPRNSIIMWNLYSSPSSSRRPSLTACKRFQTLVSKQFRWIPKITIPKSLFLGNWFMWHYVDLNIHFEEGKSIPPLYDLCLVGTQCQWRRVAVLLAHRFRTIDCGRPTLS